MQREDNFMGEISLTYDMKKFAHGQVKYKIKVRNSAGSSSQVL